MDGRFQALYLFFFFYLFIYYYNQWFLFNSRQWFKTSKKVPQKWEWSISFCLWCFLPEAESPTFFSKMWCSSSVFYYNVIHLKNKFKNKNKLKKTSIKCLEAFLNVISNFLISFLNDNKSSHRLPFLHQTNNWFSHNSLFS